MVDVRVVRMRVYHRRVAMRVRVRLGVGYRRVRHVVLVLVMDVVHVWVTMIHGLVRVLVFVPLGEVKQHTDRHERPR
jgi:hypothetical protein